MKVYESFQALNEALKQGLDEEPKPENPIRTGADH